jgi:hypothetical protein
VNHLTATHTKEISADVSGYNAARCTETGIATHRRQTHLPDIDQANKHHFAEEPSASSQRHSPRAGAHTVLTASGKTTDHAASPSEHRDRLHHHAISGASPDKIAGLQDRNTDCPSVSQLSGVAGTITVRGMKIVPFAFNGKTVADGSDNKPHHPRPNTCGLIQPMSYRKQTLA